MVECKECLCYETDVCLNCSIQTKNYGFGRNYYTPNKFIKQIDQLRTELATKDEEIGQLEYGLGEAGQYCSDNHIKKIEAENKRLNRRMRELGF